MSDTMSKNTIIAIIAAAVIIIAAAGAYVLTQSGSDNNETSKDKTVTDSEGREVTVPKNLDNGIITVGWNVLKVLSYFDAHEKVVEVDFQETQPIYGSLQPHYYCYDMSKMASHEDSTMGNFSESTIESIAKKSPSLVIVTTNVYEKFQSSFDSLAKKCPVLALNLTDMSNMFYTVDASGNFTLNDSIVKSLSILGDVLGEGDVDDKVVKTLNNTLADIKSKQGSDTTTLGSLAGSQMGMGPGDLNAVFPFFHPFQMANVSNAAAGYPVPPFYTLLNVETFTSTYDFDVMFYDPSFPAAIANPDDQAVLKWMYSLQGTDDEKKVYSCLTTALCGYEMMNVIADAYYFEVVIGKTLTLDQMESILTKLYKDLYGDDVGSKMFNNLDKASASRGASLAVPVETGLWTELKVVLNNGAYSFASA